MFIAIKPTANIRFLFLRALRVLRGGVFLCFPLAGIGSPDATVLYEKHCRECHGENRLGGTGPALLPQNLSRLKPGEAAQVIASGRPATQMPAFGTTLGAGDVGALTDYIYRAPAQAPCWNEGEILASRVVHFDVDKLPKTPQFESDPMNIFIVVESGDHHASVLDGDTFEIIHRFKTRFALHGGPKYSPDGRFVYFASRDGWIGKFDLYNLKTVAEVRAGINTRNLAVSHDGRYAAVANYLPHTLVLLDTATLEPVKVFDAAGRGGTGSRVSAVYTAPPRSSFIAALKDVKELWEISYADNPEPVYEGLVHDYRTGEGLAAAGRFPVRRIALDDYLDDFFFDPGYRHVFGAARNARNGQVVNLTVGRKIAELDLPGMPHLGSGITWEHQGRSVMATPHLDKGAVAVVDMNTWETVKTLETLGPGFFMRSHENTPYAWVDVFFGPHRDAVHIIDKRTLEIVKTIKPAPGKTAAHVEFTRNGSHALLSVWDRDGAVIVYEADTLNEVKRIPMDKPSGKYNVYNKITYSRGTSH